MINRQNIRTYPIMARYSKVEAANFAKKPGKKSSFSKFYGSLPNILKAKEFRSLTDDIIAARKRKKAVIFMCGAHVIKCGLNPILIELIEKDVISCVCLNGAGIIHDFEIAFCGKTSEDVAEGLKHGKFGMSRETGDFLNNAAKEGVRDGLGLGYAVAKKICESKLRFKELSLLYNAYKKEVPICVFVAIGTDIIHQHPSFDAALTAEGSARDFYSLVEYIRLLNNGGVMLNFGSAVILPEVFLKALNLSRNLGNKVKDFTTANFDMFYHYRPSQNVVSRPVELGGKGYYILGHHEIMLPLLAQSIIEKI
jgi:hypothetical protein